MKTESIINYALALDNIEDCKELTVDRFDIVGEILDVDLNDLLYFPNLEVLTLRNLILNIEDMINISKLTNLKKLDLINCDFANDEAILYINKLNCEELLLDGIDIDINAIDKKINKIVLRNINITSNINCNILDISKSFVDFSNINIENYNTIILSEDQYNFNKLFFIKHIGKVHFVIKNNENGIVEEEI